VCFYDAEYVLSARAKFLVYLPEEGRSGVEWEREGRGRKKGEMRW